VNRLVASAVLAAAVLVPASAAHAGEVRPLPSVQLDAASASAWSPAGRHLVTEAAEQYAERKGSTLSSAPLVYGPDGVPVFAVRPQFVRTGKGSVASLWYVATKVTKGDTVLTVFSTRDSSGDWRAVNVAAGDTEAQMQAAAPGATLLTCPRRNEWYAVDGNQVRALNADARTSIGADSVSLAAYKRKVSAGYGMMASPESSASSGMASPTGGTGTGTVLTASVIPVAKTVKTSTDFSDSVDHNYVPLTIGAVVILGGLLLRRRRSTRGA
jgi:hypothetical protein